MYPFDKDYQHPELYQEGKCQQVEGGDPFVLLSTGEAASGVLGPVLDACNVRDWMTVVHRGISELRNSQQEHVQACAGLPWLRVWSVLQTCVVLHKTMAAGRTDSSL